MKNILIIMGGQSTEHDISLITGVQTINNLDKTKYAIYPVVIDKQGRWHFSFDFLSVDKIVAYFNNKKTHQEVVLMQDKMLYIKKKNTLKKLGTMDCVILCCHGGLGENGALAGLFECIGLPFVSPSHTGSGIFMDKALSKIVFKNLEISTPQYQVISRDDYLKDEKTINKKLFNEIGFPCVIKPCNGGSSIGISFAKCKKELLSSIDNAFVYDNVIIIEKAVENLYELNIAVMKCDNEILFSQIERPCCKNKLLSFDDKYISNGKSGLNNMGRELPAKISKEQQEYMQTTATKIYKEYIKKGICRIDYLVDGKTQKIYVGEVNTIPGSMSFYLWNKPFDKILDGLINQAIFDNKKENSVQKSFDSCVLDKFTSGCKMSKL